MTTPERFPILKEPHGRLGFVPFSFVQRYNESAKRLHHQPVVDLAKRGGLSAQELCCVIQGSQWADRRWRDEAGAWANLQLIVSSEWPAWDFSNGLAPPSTVGPGFDYAEFNRLAEAAGFAAQPEATSPSVEQRIGERLAGFVESLKAPSPSEPLDAFEAFLGPASKTAPSPTPGEVEEAIHFLESECLVGNEDCDEHECGHCGGSANERFGGIDHDEFCPVKKRVATLQAALASREVGQNEKTENQP